ncbi:MAG TPA: hypothetical protein VMW16_07870 [Sedimentisphaerales bacterium]|nr:hypothetical protein [Sedimentisphaerales bacterium]
MQAAVELTKQVLADKLVAAVPCRQSRGGGVVVSGSYFPDAVKSFLRRKADEDVAVIATVNCGGGSDRLFPPGIRSNIWLTLRFVDAIIIVRYKGPMKV